MRTIYIASVISVVCLASMTCLAFGQEPSWKYFVKVGSFWYSDTPEPSKFFKILYRIDNGTITTLETNNNADVFVNIKSDKEGKFEMEIPKNFPYTNYDFDSRNYMFDISINNMQIDAHDVESQLDCQYLFSLPFKGDSQIRFSFNADYQSKKPWYGDKVDQKCISESIVSDLNDKSVLLQMNFTYPKILQDYNKGIISLPMEHDRYTNFSTDFRTTYDGYVIPYHPTGHTKKELVDDNFQEALKRMGASDLISYQVGILDRTIFHLEQEREQAKLLQDDNDVKSYSDKIDALGKQELVYHKESNNLGTELGLLQAFNIYLYKMSPEKTQAYETARDILTKKYVNGNSTQSNFITTIFVDTVKESLIVGINVPDKSVDKKQYITKLSDDVKKIIGDKISFEIQDMKICIPEDVNCMGPATKIHSPYQQFRQGVSIYSIKCDPPLELHIKEPTEPICIKPKTYDKFIEHGYFLFR